MSLRDVDRALTVTSWFLQQARESGMLFNLLDKKLQPQLEEDEEATAESLDSMQSEIIDEEEVLSSEYIYDVIHIHILVFSHSSYFSLPV